MILEINYKEKQVIIKEGGTIDEILDELDRLFKKEEMKEWIIVSDYTIQPIYPPYSSYWEPDHTLILPFLGNTTNNTSVNS